MSIQSLIQKCDANQETLNGFLSGHRELDGTITLGSDYFKQETRKYQNIFIGSNLYSDDRRYAALLIRELFQNAGDAMIDSERKHLQFQILKNHISVTDTGKGMTKDVLKKYFLKINKSSKDNGKESGGFGIGRAIIFGQESWMVLTNNMLVVGSYINYVILCYECFKQGVFVNKEESCNQCSHDCNKKHVLGTSVIVSRKNIVEETYEDVFNFFTGMMKKNDIFTMSYGKEIDGNIKTYEVELPKFELDDTEFDYEEQIKTHGSIDAETISKYFDFKYNANGRRFHTGMYLRKGMLSKDNTQEFYIPYPERLIYSEDKVHPRLVSARLRTNGLIMVGIYHPVFTVLPMLNISVQYVPLPYKYMRCVLYGKNANGISTVDSTQVFEPSRDRFAKKYEDLRFAFEKYYVQSNWIQECAKVTTDTQTIDADLTGEIMKKVFNWEESKFWEKPKEKKKKKKKENMNGGTAEECDSSASTVIIIDSDSEDQNKDQNKDANKDANVVNVRIIEGTSSRTNTSSNSSSSKTVKEKKRKKNVCRGCKQKIVMTDSKLCSRCSYQIKHFVPYELNFQKRNNYTRLEIGNNKNDDYEILLPTYAEVSRYSIMEHVKKKNWFLTYKETNVFVIAYVTLQTLIQEFVHVPIKKMIITFDSSCLGYCQKGNENKIGINIAYFLHHYGHEFDKVIGEPGDDKTLSGTIVHELAHLMDTKFRGRCDHDTHFASVLQKLLGRIHNKVTWGDLKKHLKKRVKKFYNVLYSYGFQKRRLNQKCDFFSESKGQKKRKKKAEHMMNTKKKKPNDDFCTLMSLLKKKDNTEEEYKTLETLFKKVF